MAAGPASAEPAPIDTLDGITRAVRRCWTQPRGLAVLETVEQTIRFSLKRDGSLLGEPRVTFTASGTDGRFRTMLVRAAVDALRRCTPLPLSPGLGAAVAGRPFTLRFIHRGPRGQGI